MPPDGAGDAFDDDAEGLPAAVELGVGLFLETGIDPHAASNRAAPTIDMAPLTFRWSYFSVRAKERPLDLLQADLRPCPVTSETLSRVRRATKESTSSTSRCQKALRPCHSLHRQLHVEPLDRVMRPRKTAGKSRLEPVP